MSDLAEKVESLPSTKISRLISYLFNDKESIKIKKNIELMFKDELSESNQQRLKMAFCRHVLLTIKEIILFNCLPKNIALKRFELYGEGHLIKALDKGKGVLLLTGHLGNFEISTKYSPLLLKKNVKPIYCARKPLKGFLGRWLLKSSQRYGLKILSINNAGLKIVRALKKNAVVILTYDQREKNKNLKIEAPFFNKMTSTSRSPIQISQKLGSPILLTFSFRNEDGKHIIKILPEVEMVHDTESEQSVLLNVIKINQIIEDYIRLHPEQWIYNYNRWK